MMERLEEWGEGRRAGRGRGGSQPAPQWQSQWPIDSLLDNAEGVHHSAIGGHKLIEESAGPSDGHPAEAIHPTPAQDVPCRCRGHKLLMLQCACSALHHINGGARVAVNVPGAWSSHHSAVVDSVCPLVAVLVALNDQVHLSLHKHWLPGLGEGAARAVRGVLVLVNGINGSVQEDNDPGSHTAGRKEKEGDGREQ